MSAWRLIVTDSESLSGVAPIGPDAETNHLIEDGDGAPRLEVDAHGVYDCCPEPHIECWSQVDARHVLAALNTAQAEACS